MKTEVKPLRLLAKALLLFMLINIVYAVIDPPFHKISAYNSVFPGRVRFPFGDGSDPYVVSVDNVDLMVTSHAIAAPKKPNEYRVLIIGDSSIWGEGLPVRESISEQWNQLQNRCHGRELKFYNLGYPRPSVVKDLIILDKAMEYEPDMVVWFVTLNTVVPLQVSPFIAANSDRATRVLDRYDIGFKNKHKLVSTRAAFYQKTLMGRRSELARDIKLQALGLIWSASGTDVNFTGDLVPVTLSQDVKNDVKYKTIKPEDDLRSKMLMNALVAGHDMAASLPILIVNEPIFIATGYNKEVRYNEIYPRWAYDQYREVMHSEADKNGWNYLDLWNAIPVEYFSDARFHLSGEGERLLVEQVNPTLQSIACH